MKKPAPPPPCPGLSATVVNPNAPKPAPPEARESEIDRNRREGREALQRLGLWKDRT